MMTLEQSKVENFPFKEGERVRVNWREFPAEEATIAKLCTSIQWGHEVVYCVLIQTEKSDKPFGVSATILEKISSEK